MSLGAGDLVVMVAGAVGSVTDSKIGSPLRSPFTISTTPESTAATG